jgi:bifunctional DNase/RNase
MKPLGAIALLSLALTGAAGPAERAPAGPPGAAAPQEVEVVAAGIDPSSRTPVVLLKRKRDDRLFSMVIDPAQLHSIAIPLNGMTPPRPLTHDLFLTLFGRLKVALVRAVITDLRDDIYYATVSFTVNGSEFSLDARPSDAIALAIRAKVPVLVEDRVFDKSGAAPAKRRPAI